MKVLSRKLVFVLIVITLVSIIINYKNNKDVITKPAGKMFYARFNSHSIKLNDGKILTMGGEIESKDSSQYGSVKTDTIEIFDPKTKKSHYMGLYDNSINQSDFTATLLSNGNVLIAGGRDLHSNDVNETKLFDSKTQEFKNGSKLNYTHAEHTATLLNDGQVLIIGGSAGPIINKYRTCPNKAELYDPNGKRFDLTSGMVYPRRWRHSAVLLTDGRVLIAGGGVCGDKSGDYSNKAEIYNPKTNKFYPTGNLNVNRGYLTMVLLNDGNVLVLGGYNNKQWRVKEIELYNTKTGLFKTIGYLDDRASFATKVLPNGKVLIIGGSTGIAWKIHSLRDIQEFDPVTHKLKFVGYMILPRSNPNLVDLQNGKLLIIGGNKNPLIEALIE